jgi:hypothetical protein
VWSALVGLAAFHPTTLMEALARNRPSVPCPAEVARAVGMAMPVQELEQAEQPGLSQEQHIACDGLATTLIAPPVVTAALHCSELGALAAFILTRAVAMRALAQAAVEAAGAPARHPIPVAVAATE